MPDNHHYQHIIYTHDPLNRLTSATYSTGEHFEYAYDAVGNRTVMTDATGVHTYTYDTANRLTSVGGVPYTWDARGNMVSDGTFTYTYSAAGRMVRAESLTVTLVYTYNAQGLRVAQSVDGSVTTFAWDWASGVPEMLSGGDNLYLVGHDTLGRWDGAAWAYHLPDALGSVRQVADGAGTVVSSREWTPYGVEVGGGQAGLGFTGEWFDGSAGLLYLRARWYAPEVGRFTRKDPWRGTPHHPMSYNAWLYVYANPINLTDSSGYWDDDSRAKIKVLEQAFLDSAARHNRIWRMDDNAFAALIASTMEKERRIGDFPSWEENKWRSRWGQRAENLLVNVGCIVSGDYWKACMEEGDWQQCWRYLLNEIPEGHHLNVLASVGIGNVKLWTAAMLWKKQACSITLGEEQCVALEEMSLLAGMSNPFDPQVVCSPLGACATYEPSETKSYRTIGLQLLNDEKNIEYVAANLEAGALRAKSLGLDPPSAFSAVLWHKQGIQTFNEIRRSGRQAYTRGPISVMDNVPIPLSIWSLTTSWDVSKEPAYEEYGNKTEYEWWKQWLAEH